MALDLPPAAPAGAPQAAIVAPAPQAAEPLYVDSHGYRYAVTGNTLLAPETVVATIEGAATPKEAIEALNAEYQRRGYFLTAIGGNVSNKLVALVVVQGRLTEPEITPGLAPFFAGLEERDDVTRNALLRRSALAELYSNRQGMRPKIAFAPAAAVGGSKMTVTEEEIPGAKPWSAGLAFGNLGSRYSSRYTAGATGSVRPGGGLELSANYTQGLPGMTADSGGSQYQAGGLGLSVVTPLGVYGANWSGIAYQIGESAAPLYPIGDINTAGVTGTQLLFASETARLAANESFTYNDNVVTVFSNVSPFKLTDQHYGVVAAGLVYSDSVAILGKNANYSVGVTASKGTSNRGGTFVPVTIGVADPRFGMLQANFNYGQALPAGFSLSLALSGQWADSTVPQNQQWVIGGFGNLTAWLPAALVGDGGSLGRLNLTTPGYAWQGYGVTGSAFVEAGLVRSQVTPANNPVTRSLADAGLSLSATTPFGTVASLAYAWPIASRNVDLDVINNQSRAHLYFSLNQSF